MRRPPLAAPLFLATALIAAAAVARADTEEAPPRDTEEQVPEGRGTIVEIWTALGSADLTKVDGYSSGDFMYMTGVLGLVRFAPIEFGLALDFGGRDDDSSFLIGPLAGVGFDIVRGFRFEALLQIGGHYLDGIGYDWEFEEGASGQRSLWLWQAGLRAGLSARIGRETPRIVVGGWVAAIRDLGTATRTISFGGGSGTEVWEVGGSMGLIAVRFGFEW